MALIRQLLSVQVPHAFPQLEALYNQLSQNPVPATVAGIQSALSWPTTIVLVASVPRKIVGMGTLVLIPLMSKTVGTIQDVVVADSHRGQGLGRELVEALLDRARGNKLTYCELTCNPDRIAANALYKNMGFKLRETNQYRYQLE